MRNAYPIGLVLATFVACAAQAATLTVTTTADAGAGSLRQALIDAQAPGPDTIVFSPALAGMTIAPATNLPMITDAATTIDGDLGADCDPDINVNGSGLTSQLGHFAVTGSATSAVIRGLALHGFPGTPIAATGTGATIECNFLGTDTGGTAVLPNGTATPQAVGVHVSGSDNTVSRNLIANSRSFGVRVQDGQTNGYPDFTALVSDAPPRVYAQLVFSESCGSFTNTAEAFTPVDGAGRPFTDTFGMRLRGFVAVGTSGTYTFNFAGLDDNARLRIDGVTVADLSGGGTTSATSTLSMGTHAIEIDFRENGGASRLTPTITGPGPATLTSDAPCTIGQPGLCAELFQLRVPSEGNTITRNRIRDNGGLGIGLSICQYPNDAGDADVGPNRLLNSPVIGALTSLGGGDFSVTGTAPPGSTVEVFQAAADATGFGEGAVFVASGTASMSGNFAVVGPIASSGALTATATDADGNTSEFGRNFTYSTGASGLYAAARSVSSIELFWTDPNLGENGFRVERSTNGSVYTTAGTVGANATTFLDTSLGANTLYYYRVIATSAGGDGPASNRATASTFPATVAPVCYQRYDRDAPFVNTSSVAYDGIAYAIAYTERNPGVDNLDLVFRRYDPATLAPIGPVVPVSLDDMNAQAPVSLVWNGARHGLLWLESVRGAAGAEAESPMMFALLDIDGTKLRGNVRIPVPATFDFIRLLWDGTHWGVFGTTITGDPAQPDATFDTYFLRFTEDGDVVAGPVLIATTPALSELQVQAAWSPQLGQYGVVVTQGADTAWDVAFRRYDANGTAVDPAPVVLDALALPTGQFGVGSNAIVWDGSAWAVAYSKPVLTPGELGVYLRQVSSSAVPLGVGPTRISDDVADSSNPLAILTKPGGGYAVFAQTNVGGQLEVTRMQATAGGARDGSRVFVTPNDGQSSQRAAFAGDGTNFLVTFGQGANGTITQELQAVRLAADGSGVPPAPVVLTSGHGPNGADIPRGQWTAPLGAGFVAVWVDGQPGVFRINARVYNGTGQVVSTLAPLTATSTQGVVGLASVGNSFALAWKTLANDVVFARYNATGGSITGERTIASAVGGNANLAFGWDGENYAIFYTIAGGNRMQRVDENGNLVGTAVALVRGPDTLGTLQWLGDGWALLTRNGVTLPGSLEYVRYSQTGAVLDGPVAVETAVSSSRGPRSQQVAFNGRDLAAVWLDWEGEDPPGDDVFFTVINRDGTKAFDDVAIVSTALTDAQPEVYASGTNFRVLTNGFGARIGLREIEVTPAGVVQGLPRFLSNRPSAIGPVALAFNGVTTATLYFPSGLQHLYFHTSACLADATPPTCPAVATGFANGAITLGWTAASDPETGVVRYGVYRGGVQLAELDADVLAFADGGYDRGGANAYQVRALNGGLIESAGCPTTTPDITMVFADGFEN